MVTLPIDFVAIKYPGYFWNLKEKKLYTMKISGILRPLSKSNPSHWNHYIDAYRVSVNGERRNVQMEYLKKLRVTNSVIPVEKI
jgi:type II restriction/modification system DNA methylase subunit YeeA